MSPLGRRLLVAWWRIANPLTRPFAGVAPWWVLLETTGGKTGRLRVVPLAAGPRDGDGMWLIAVHGRRSGWVRNIEAERRVRLKHRGRWRDGTAEIHPMDTLPLERFGAYARSGARLVGVDPLQVRVSF